MHLGSQKQLNLDMCSVHFLDWGQYENDWGGERG